MLFLFIGNLNGWILLPTLAAIYISASVWIYAWFDLARSRFLRESDKIGWQQLITYLPLLGALIYLVIESNQKIA